MKESTLTLYRKLKEQNPNILGMQLKDLNNATLTLNAKVVDLPSVHQAIDDFANKYNINAGWAMLGDEVILTTHAPDSENLLQAQYTDETNSLHIQHLGQNQYQLTWFEVTGSEECQYCYKEQHLVLRPNFDKSHAKVRFWFKEIDHRWQPVVQQFVGLTNLAQG